MCLDGLAGVAAAQARPARAARLLGAAEALREAIGAPTPPAGRAAHEREVAALRAALDGEAYAAAWADGRALPLERAVDYAMRVEAPAAQRPGERPEPRLGPLTPRQQEVAALIARGLTSRQIADELVLTESTAETHVKHILHKLGFASRAQIAAWVVEQRSRAAPPKPAS
jgi:non-specific serine/threonine protein kinase